MRVLLVLLCCLSATRAAPEVTVSGQGELRGRLSSYSDDVAVFVNIPYAAPPVGDLRWRPPQPATPWKGVKDAFTNGNQCVPLSAPPPGQDAVKKTRQDIMSRKLVAAFGYYYSEDCLYLHVAAPTAALTSGAKLPVMFWIHGGGYTMGSGYDYGPDAMVWDSNLSTVVVTVNYRLGLFGFLGSSELRRRQNGGSTGNFGIQDQRFALQWVKQHIHAFGGNGDDVTIFGESAGGVSIWMHLVQTASFGLYSKAIIESGTGGTTTPWEAAEDEYSKLLNGTGCSGVGCLLNVDVDSLLLNASASGLSAGGKWAPVVDGISLAMTPQDLMAHGVFNNYVPVIIGSNRDENGLWTIMDQVTFPFNMTEHEFDAWFEAAKDPSRGPQLSIPQGAELGKVKEVYNPEAYPFPTESFTTLSQWWWTATRVLTDKIPNVGNCAVRWLARCFAKGGSPAVYTYLFAYPSPDNGVNPYLPSPLLAVHADEVSYVFGYPGVLWPNSTMQKRAGISFPTASQADLGHKMSAYWQAFAKGEPEPVNSAPWPVYTPEGDASLRFDATPNGIHQQTGLRAQACDYWEEVFNKPCLDNRHSHP